MIHSVGLWYLLRTQKYKYTSNIYIGKYWIGPHPSMVRRMELALKKIGAGCVWYLVPHTAVK